MIVKFKSLLPWILNRNETIMKRLIKLLKDFFFPVYPRVKSDEEAWKEDAEAIKKDWESVVGKDDGKNPNWKRR